MQTAIEADSLGVSPAPIRIWGWGPQTGLWALEVMGECSEHSLPANARDHRWERAAAEKILGPDDRGAPDVCECDQGIPLIN